MWKWNVWLASVGISCEPPTLRRLGRGTETAWDLTPMTTECGVRGMG